MCRSPARSRRSPGCCRGTPASGPTGPHPREGPRDLANPDWREYHDHVRDFALGLAALASGRREALGDRDNRPRSTRRSSPRRPGRHRGPGLPGLDRPRAAVRVESRRAAIIVARTRSRWTRSSRCATSSRPALRDLRRRARLTRSRFDWLKSFTRSRSSDANTRSSTRTPSRRRWIRGSPRPGHDLLHLRDDRQPEGRDADARQVVHRAHVHGRGGLRATDEWLCYLPMAWVGDSLYSLVLSMAAGFCCNCPESPETVQRDLRELGPTTVLAPPRIWENMLTSVQVRAADATPLNGGCFERFAASRRRRDPALGRQSPSRSGSGCRARSGSSGLRPDPRQLGLRRAAGRIRAAPARPGHLPLLPLHRGEPQAGLRFHESSALISIQPDAEANPTSAGGRVRVSR